VVRSLAREGGLPSVLWAGPEQFSAAMKWGEEAVQGTRRNKPVHLRYLLWIAALLTPRPPPLLVLNEPESSLHPDLLPALARLVALAARSSQVIVVSHAARLLAALEQAEGLELRSIVLEKELGETRILNLEPGESPRWQWPSR